MSFLRRMPLSFWVACLVGLAMTPSFHAAESASPPQVKAAFLFNFLKFVDWPESAFKTPQSPYVVGILGKDPFGHVLEETFENKSFNGRAVTLRRIGLDGATDCHLIFICPSESRDLSRILEKLNAKPVLTVGDSQGFASDGGMVNFYQEGNKIRFEINIDATRRASLKVHSTLLALAKIVKDR